MRNRPLSLCFFPDPLLRDKSEPVDSFDTVLQDFSNDMLAFMKKNNGIGLAATQVGVLKRIIVADLGNSPFCLINPEIQKASGENKMTEGCLSVPDATVEISRRTKIDVRGKDIKGKDIFIETKGLLARVLQHEIDHLNGVLICDYEKES